MTTESEKQPKRRPKKKRRPEWLDNSHFAKELHFNESGLRYINEPALKDVLEAMPGDSPKDKNIEFEVAVKSGSGKRKDTSRKGGETAKELLEKGRPITPRVMKNAIRWFVDKGKEMPHSVHLASALIQYLQMELFRNESLAESGAVISQQIDKLLVEAEKSPDPAYARHLIGEMLRSYIPADAHRFFQFGLRPKSG